MSLIKKYIEKNNFGKKLGMHFNIISDGEVEYFLKITQDHLATPHAAHGGVISALADAALGVCALSAVHKENKVVSTVEYKINFLSPALLNDELYAYAKVLQKGKRILIVECAIFCKSRLPLEGAAEVQWTSERASAKAAEQKTGEEGKLIAKATGTFNAYDAAKAGY